MWRATHEARAVAWTVALALLCAGTAACGDGPGRPRAGPGSTLAGTFVDRNGDGVLERAAGEPLRPRTDLAPAAGERRVLAVFAQVTDTHVTDEESPLRAEVLDRLGGRFSSAFRPQEALSAQVLAAMEVTLRALRPSFVVESGDLIDNAQGNELALALGVLRGGRVRPDSGAAGYAGVQEATSPDPFVYRPAIDAPRHPGLLAAAERPFRAPGLGAPWLPLISNHDLLVQGLVPATPALARIAVSDRKLVRPPAGAIAAARDGRLTPSDVAQLLQTIAPGDQRTVPADAARRPYTPLGAARTVASSAGLRLTHGLLLWTHALAPGVTMLGLDTADRRGGAAGIVTPAAFAWVRAELRRHRGDLLVVASPTPLEETPGGAPLLSLLDRTPGVVAVIAGDTHRNRIRARRRPGGGYWLVRTSSLADYPQQARAFRLVRLADGRVALDTWVLDHAGRVGASGYLGLAGISRALAFLDPQGGRPRDLAGSAGDRNARLFLPSLGVQHADHAGS